MPRSDLQQSGCFSGLLGVRGGWKLRSPLVRRVGGNRKDSGVVVGPAVPSYYSVDEKVPAYSELGVPERAEHKCSLVHGDCDFSYGPKSEAWRIGDHSTYTSQTASRLVLDANLLKTIEAKLDEINPDLRELSKKIHANPELGFQERYASKHLMKFMGNHGFCVTPCYLGLETAFRAEYTHGSGGRVLGVNSEMDALPNMGHACGHNLIAISGVGIAIAVKEALKAHNVSGKVVLLGTPAEEGGAGKVLLIERGGYSDMDACIMCHPTVGAPQTASDGTTNALQGIGVEYFGKAAHAGAAPWEGINALDAAVQAYSNISALRQQMKPDCRVHGIVEGNGWAPNVIPDYSKLTYLVRAPSIAEVNELVKRVKACFEAAAIATGCRVEMSFELPYYDLRQNKALSENFGDRISRYGMGLTHNSTTASTDFGNVSYEIPSLHPLYAIPTQPGGGNHTPAFTASAITQEAHDATMLVTKGLAHTGFRFLLDDAFAEEVEGEFRNGK
ncbi:hypothetical protein BDZ94DRAFT_1196088 [Collybia nuda]|uniref:Peptidase M20 dimerisation domain-containing protein n=1 Tax=Collybia nuda TaxID=64659 RepID=A0A9P5Y4N2_9AGAR|nr:hypothetical protein BDZ94DRAFT_1196088 [Collybia nuda]